MSDNVFVVPAGSDGDPRLEPFKEMNESTPSRKKVPWEDRVKVIRQQFPSVSRLDWNQVFQQDPVILGRIINDIIKADVSQPGKAGKRPGLDEETARDAWRRIQNDDYTVEPFTAAFKQLQGDRSIRGLAAKVGLTRPHVFRLLNGEAFPSAYDMEQIAKAFRKHPSYFYEYRLAYITAVLSEQMSRYKESTVVFYSKIQDARRGE